MANGKKDEELKYIERKHYKAEEVKKAKELKYKEPKYIERPASKPLTIVWDTIQKVLEGTLGGYEKAAKALEKSRKRMEGKTEKIEID